MKSSLTKYISLFIIPLKASNPEDPNVVRMVRDELKMASIPFYTFTTTNFFDDTVYCDRIAQNIDAVILNTRKYLSENENYPNESTEKNPEEILLYLYENIIGGFESYGLYEIVDNLNFRTEVTFFNMTLFSEKVLSGYLDFTKKKRFMYYVFQKLDWFAKYASYLISYATEKDIAPNHIASVEEMVDFLKQGRKSGWFSDDKFRVFIRDSLCNIGYLLLLLEIKHTAQPEGYSLYSRLKNELGILLTVVKMIVFKSGIAPDERYLVLDTDVKNYMGQVYQAFNRMNVENVDNEGNVENESISIKRFLEQETTLIESTIEAWLLESDRIQPDFSEPNSIQNYILKNYIESLHLASIDIKDNERRFETLD